MKFDNEMLKPVTWNYTANMWSIILHLIKFFGPRRDVIKNACKLITETNSANIKKIIKVIHENAAI